MTGQRGPVRLALYTGAREWGGAEIVLGHLLSSFGDDIEPELLGVDAEVLQRLAAYRPGCTCTLVPAVHDDRDLAALTALRRALRRARPDLVQLNLPVPFAEPYAVLAAVTLLRLPTMTVHHLPMSIESWRVRLLATCTARAVAAHVAVGAAVASDVERLMHLRAGSVRIVPNGVPPPAAAPVPARPAQAGFVVGAVGRLHRQKGLDVLLRALTRMPDAHAILVGDGPERVPLQRLATELGVADRMTITGWTQTPTAYLPSFDALAMPSRLEGLPLALLEAMHAGCAVVASAVGSIPEAVQDGRTGLLVPVDDPAALAAALGRLAADAALRARLGAAAAELAGERFTVAAMARGYQRVYADVLGGRRRFTAPGRSSGARSRRRPSR